MVAITVHSDFGAYMKKKKILECPINIWLVPKDDIPSPQKTLVMIQKILVLWLESSQVYETPDITWNNIKSKAYYMRYNNYWKAKKEVKPKQNLFWRKGLQITGQMLALQTADVRVVGRHPDPRLCLSSVLHFMVPGYFEDEFFSAALTVAQLILNNRK